MKDSDTERERTICDAERSPSLKNVKIRMEGIDEAIDVIRREMERLCAAE
jgi:hypothetical protein